MKAKIAIIAVQMLMAAIIFQPAKSLAQPLPVEELPYYLQDRGTGIPTSQFGTYVRKGELLIYPFYEYYYDSN